MNGCVATSTKAPTTPTDPKVNPFKSTKGPSTSLQSENTTLKSILSEIKSIQTQQHVNNATLTELKTIMTDYKTIMDNIIQENIELRNEITILHSKLNNIDHLLDTKDQSGLDHNLIINGATEVKDE